ncbi:MAG: hypothetical protein AB7Q97_05260 [Gammaproteobacteria bacterium]
MTQPPRRRSNTLKTVIVGVLLGWTFLYNLLIKDLGPVESFFHILDTISDDFLVGTIFTIALGVGIALVFSFTKLYSQITANVYSFRMLEIMYFEHLRHGDVQGYFHRLLNFQDQPRPQECCPSRVSAMMFALAFTFVMSWVYLIVFSEALFFLSWSAGVDLPITDQNLLLLPTLALAIPFSARVMAYARYRYAQDYADFMPGAVFALLVVFTLGQLYQSDDQKFFLTQVFANRDYLLPYLKNGALLAFIPVFFEGMFWLYELSQDPEPPGDAQ